MTERWKQIPKWHYEVSSKGRVRRSVGGQGTRLGYILKPKPHVAGYLMVDLCKNNETPVRFAINHLVALAFKGPRPSKKHDAAHWDGDPKNNVPKNIRWATRKENMADADRHGRRPRGSKHPLAKLTEAKVRRMRRERAKGKTFKQLSKMFGVNPSNCHSAVTGKQWSHVHA